MNHAVAHSCNQVARQRARIGAEIVCFTGRGLVQSCTLDCGPVEVLLPEQLVKVKIILAVVVAMIEKAGGTVLGTVVFRIMEAVAREYGQVQRIEVDMMLITSWSP